MSTKPKLKQTKLPIKQASEPQDLTNTDDTASVELFDPELDERNGKREPFTEAQKMWLSSKLPRFYSLPHEQPHHPQVKAYKNEIANEYVKEFKFTGDLNKHRSRVRRWISNQKRVDCPSSANRSLSEKESNILANFFDRDRTITGRALFLRENKALIKERTDAKLPSLEPGKTRRGLSSTVQKEAYDALTEEEKAEYDRRAAAENAQTRVSCNGCIDDATVEDNQRKAPNVLQRLLSGLGGRGNSYSVGDAVFHIQFAFRSPSGEVIIDKIHTGFEGKFFYDNRAYKKGKVTKSWVSFVSEVFGQSGTKSCLISQERASSSDETELQQEEGFIVNSSPPPEADYQTVFSNLQTKAASYSLHSDGIESSGPAPIHELARPTETSPSVTSDVLTPVMTDHGSEVAEALDLPVRANVVCPAISSASLPLDSPIQSEHGVTSYLDVRADSAELGESQFLSAATMSVGTGTVPIHYVASPVSTQKPHCIAEPPDSITVADQVTEAPRTSMKRSAESSSADQERGQQRTKKRRSENMTATNTQRKSTRKIKQPQRMNLDLPDSAKNKKNRK